MEKMTKVMKYAMVKEIVMAADIEEDVRVELIGLCEDEIAMIERKAVKAKERAAAKKAEADVIIDQVKAVLTDELQTVEQIVAAIGDEDVTKGKVVNRMKKLIEAEVAIKDFVKVDKRKVVAYKLAQCKNNGGDFGHPLFVYRRIYEILYEIFKNIQVS